MMEFENYFEKIFSGDPSVKSGLIEYCGREALLKYQLKYSKKRILVYGAGRIGFYTAFWLKQMGIEIDFFVDRNPAKLGEIILGNKIIDWDQLENTVNERNGVNYLCIIAVNLGEEANDIKKQLYKLGISEIFDINIGHIYDSPASGWAYEYYQAKDEFKSILNLLWDDESKETLCELIRSSLFNDFYRLKVYPSFEKYWGEGFLGDEDEKYLACIGGGIGDTVYYFLDKFSERFNKVYCFEPELWKVLERNLNVLPVEIKQKIEIIRRYVSDKVSDKETTLNEFFENRKVTLITMDIEGMELIALKGGADIIRNQMPILAISAYHKWDDLISITKFIGKISPEYKFFVRKYAALHRMDSNETVLYAVPVKRLRNGTNMHL
ncbi:MAG: FkbM family methyltransferase [Clostridiales bacterium]|nr:FkbM family methyltransferase [Clostridiales bacterium]